MVLGFGASKNVGEIVSTSYPLTYALPGDILYKLKLSVGVSPP